LETRVIVDKGLSVIHGILNETFVLGIFWCIYFINMFGSRTRAKTVHLVTEQLRRNSCYFASKNNYNDFRVYFICRCYGGAMHSACSKVILIGQLRWFCILLAFVVWTAL
jgi:hypothetical protein